LITYRVVHFRCNCKYIYTGISNRPKKCPEHNKAQLTVTFWCDMCGTKYVVPPLQGTKKRCYECSKYQHRGLVNRRWQKKYNEKHDILELTSESLFEKDDRHLEEWYESCRHLPPILETPVLDSYESP